MSFAFHRGHPRLLMGLIFVALYSPISAVSVFIGDEIYCIDTDVSVLFATLLGLILLPFVLFLRWDGRTFPDRLKAWLEKKYWQKT